MTIEQPEQGANLQFVQKKVIEQLQPYWTDKGVTLTRKNIRVFCVSNGKMTLVGEDLRPLALIEETRQQGDFGEEKKEEASTKDDIPALFFALEYFTTVPINLFRTAWNSQLEPATFTHPDYASSFTCASPLYYTGFNMGKDEGTIPWYNVIDDQLKVNGVSLSCLDGAEVSVENGFDPFGPIGPNEKKGVSKMTMEQYSELANFQDTYDPNFGILKTSVNYRGNQFACKPNFVDVAPRERKARGKTLAAKRFTYFRFRLEKGLDLYAYGVAVVYDNSSPNHFSLVLTNVPDHKRHRFWNDQPGKLKLYLPVECFPKFDSVKNDEKGLANFLRKEVFTPSAEDIEPEMMYHGGFMYLPNVASFFALYDLKVVANAEPAPPTGDFDDERIKLYNGAVVLYHISDDLDDWDVTSAIEQLEKANYVLQDLDPSFCEILVDNLDQQDYTTQLENLDESVCDALLGTLKDLEAGYEQAEWALDEMLEALRRRSEEDNVAPSLPPTGDQEKTPITRNCLSEWFETPEVRAPGSKKTEPDSVSEFARHTNKESDGLQQTNAMTDESRGA